MFDESLSKERRQELAKNIDQNIEEIINTSASDIAISKGVDALTDVKNQFIYKMTLGEGGGFTLTLTFEVVDITKVANKLRNTDIILDAVLP